MFFDVSVSGAVRTLKGDLPTSTTRVLMLENRVRLQAPGFELFILVADYQTITDRHSTASLPRDVTAQVADYLAIGIEPERATIFTHLTATGDAGVDEAESFTIADRVRLHERRTEAPEPACDLLKRHLDVDYPRRYLAVASSTETARMAAAHTSERAM